MASSHQWTRPRLSPVASTMRAVALVPATRASQADIEPPCRGDGLRLSCLVSQLPSSLYPHSSTPTGNRLCLLLVMELSTSSNAPHHRLVCRCRLLRRLLRAAAFLDALHFGLGSLIRLAHLDEIPEEDWACRHRVRTCRKWLGMVITTKCKGEQAGGRLRPLQSRFWGKGWLRIPRGSEALWLVAEIGAV